jgi:hypothetical protein
MQTLKDYNLAMSIFFDMTNDLPRKMIRRETIPFKALKDLQRKYLEGKSDDDYVELVALWENLKPIPKETDPDGLLDLMLELDERMQDVHPDLKKAPIEFYAKYRRLLHKDYDACIRAFTLDRAKRVYKPIDQEDFDDLARIIGDYWKTQFKKEDTSILEKAAIYNLSSGGKCDHCGKGNHSAYKDGKPFCFKLIKDLKGDNNNNKNNKKKFCRYCKSREHDTDDCDKLAKKK